MKFWSVYLIVAFLIVGGIYFATEGATEPPLVLSDDAMLSEAQMEQIMGSGENMNCVSIPPCQAIPCPQNGTIEIESGQTVHQCDSETGQTCTYLETKTLYCLYKYYALPNCQGGVVDAYPDEWPDCQ